MRRRINRPKSIATLLNSYIHSVTIVEPDWNTASHPETTACFTYKKLSILKVYALILISLVLEDKQFATITVTVNYN